MPRNKNYIIFYTERKINGKYNCHLWNRCVYLSRLKERERKEFVQSSLSLLHGE